MFVLNSLIRTIIFMYIYFRILIYKNNDTNENDGAERIFRVWKKKGNAYKERNR